MFVSFDREGYEEHGRGAVFCCEVWEATPPKSDALVLARYGARVCQRRTEIQQAVAVYRPLSEGVVVIVTRHDEVFVARLRLPTDDSAVGTRMN